MMFRQYFCTSTKKNNHFFIIFHKVGLGATCYDFIYNSKRLMLCVCKLHTRVDVESFFSICSEKITERDTFSISYFIRYVRSVVWTLASQLITQLDSDYLTTLAFVQRAHKKKVVRNSMFCVMMSLNESCIRFVSDYITQMQL